MNSKGSLRNFFLLFSFFVILFNTQAQDKKDIKNLENQAREYFRIEEYNTALPIYKKLDSLKPNTPEYLARLGICYMGTYLKPDALNLLKKAKDLGYHKDHIDYYLAEAYHFNYEFNKAIQYYEVSLKHLKVDKAEDAVRIKRIRHSIEMCQNGKELVKHPVDIKLENLGPKINTKNEEYAPVISADETELIFTSKRPSTTGGKMDEFGEYFEDIYISNKDEKGNWSEPKSIGSNINTPGHEGSVGLSPDGQKLFVYKDVGSGDLFYSDLSGDQWAVPKKLPGGVNQPKYHEPSASTTPNEKLLFFSSDRPGGFGGYDIYRSKLLPNGEWALPVNLGSTINTPYDDEAPFIHPNGTTLYFSSKGHTSMGGYDVFSAEIISADSFTVPVNVGYPINTTDDDIFFVWSPDGTRAYFSSHRDQSFGEKDIYMLTRPKPSVHIVILKGKVLSKDSAQKHAVPATITITDNLTKEVVGIYNTNSYTGKYTVILPPGKNFGLSIEAEGFLPYSENVNIPPSENFLEVTKDFLLDPLKKGSIMVLKNVFFDTDKWDLREESSIELEKFYKVLVQNPTLYVEIAGHTDDVGTDEYNLKLSQNRADAVVKYLSDKGIEPNRLFAEGYGEDFPLAANDTEEGRQQNRRTELIIVESLKQGGKVNFGEGFYNKRKNENENKNTDELKIKVSPNKKKVKVN